MEQTILLSKNEHANDNLPFTIVNKKPVFSADEEAKNRNYVEKELYAVYKKYCTY